MNPDEMEPGRELDALVAEKVMGEPFREPTHGVCCTCQTCGFPHDECRCGYSYDIEMAWRVVDKMTSQTGWGCCLEYENGEWECIFTHDFENAKYGYGNTAESAICRAALDMEVAE